MNSDDDEIPPSQPVKNSPRKPRKRVKASPKIRSKRSKLSLTKCDKINQDKIMSKLTRSSSDDYINKNIYVKPKSKDLTLSLDSGTKRIQTFRKKIKCNVNIYLSSDELVDENEEPNRIENFDVLSSAKLLERANRNNLPSSTVRKSIILADSHSPGLISLAKIIEKESESSAILSPTHFANTQQTQPNVCTAQCPKTPTGIELDTQFSGITESQLWRVCSVADEAQSCFQQNLQLSQWISPIKKKPTEQNQHTLSTIPIGENVETAELEYHGYKENSIVQNILKDFEVNSPQTGHKKPLDESLRNDDALLATASLVLRKRNLRTYSRTKAAQPPDTSYHRPIFHLDDDDDDSSDSNRDVNYENFVSHIDDSNENEIVPVYCLENDDMDININTSQKIVENLHNLSNYFFSQSNTFYEENKENFSFRSTDRPTRIENKAEVPREINAKTERNHNESLKQTVSNQPKESIKNEIVKKEMCSQNKLKASLSHCEKSLLDEDDHIFLSISTPQSLSHCGKRNNPNRRFFDTTPSSSRNPDLRMNIGASTSTPIAEKKLKDLPFPKRLRFENETQFNEIVPFQGTSSTALNSFSTSEGFSTARGKSIAISEKAMKKSSKIFDEIQNQTSDETMDQNLKPNSFGGFKTGAGSAIKVSETHLRKYTNVFQDISEKLEVSTMAVNNFPASDFRTGGGKTIQISEDRIKKSTMLFEGEVDPFDAGGRVTGPTSSVAEVTPITETSAPCLQGFTTGRGKTIKVSEKLLHKTDKIFKNIASDLTMNDFGEDLLQTTFDEPNEVKNDYDPISSTSRDFHSLKSEKYVRNVNVNNFESPNQWNDMLDSSAKTTLSCQNTLSQAFSSQLNTAEFLAEAYKTPTNYRSSTSITRNSLATSTPMNSSNSKQINDRQESSISHQVTIIDQNSTTTEDSIEFLEQFDNVQMFLEADFPLESQKTSDDRKRMKQICLADKFENSFNGSQTLLNTNHKDDEIISVSVTEEVRNKRQQSFIEQQEKITSRTKRVHPHPGSLHLEKALAFSKTPLSDLGVPTNYTPSQLQNLDLHESTINFNVSNVSEFKFNMANYYPANVCETNTDGIRLPDDMILIMDENSCVGIDALKNSFLNCPTVDPKLVPKNWVENALKWIIWKLASYELHFPKEFGRKALTPENVLIQLKFRYYREIDSTERSAVRKIVEGDDVASKRLVLFVSNIIENNFASILELSDGWYAIRTSALDVVLRKAVRCGKIKIGTKLILQGAELCGATDGHSPLELPDSVVLKISANSTRRAKWNTKLGYYHHLSPFLLSLNSIDENGGSIAKLRVYVLRVYPTMYLHKEKCDGVPKTVFRSQQAEKRQNISDDQRRLEMIERLYIEVTTEVEEEYEKRRKSIKAPKKKLQNIDDAEEMWEFLEHSNNPADIEMELSSTQQKMVSEFYTKIYNEKMDEISCRVKDRLNLTELKPKSTPLLKIRIIDARQPMANKSAMLCIWSANELHHEIMENRFYDIINSSASGIRVKDLQITANRSTIFRETLSSSIQTQEIHLELQRTCSDITEVTSKDFKPHFNEFDTVGYVLMIDDAEPKFQSVYLVNATKKILCVKFWNNISQFAYDDVIRVGRFLAIKNLEWRSVNAFDRKGNCQGFTTELTTFTENPKSKLLAEHLHRLRDEFKQITDLESFENECRQMVEQAKLVNRGSTSTSLGTTNTSNISIPSPTSSVLQKFVKLNEYGQPPPLSPLIITNHSLDESIRRPFKKPVNDAVSSSSSLI